MLWWFDTLGSLNTLEGILIATQRLSCAETSFAVDSDEAAAVLGFVSDLMQVHMAELALAHYALTFDPAVANTVPATAIDQL